MIIKKSVMVAQNCITVFQMDMTDGNKRVSVQLPLSAVRDELVEDQKKFILHYNLSRSVGFSLGRLPYTDQC